MKQPFSARWLNDRLQQIAGGGSGRILCALSGGADSLALAHALKDLSWPLQLIHVNHHLHRASDRWAQQLAHLAAQWQVSLITLDVNIDQTRNIEAQARAARYAVMAQHMVDGDCLLTAHHEQDQALTVLLQLMRGSGPAGLAAMPMRARFSAGWHLRPLLDVTQEALADYCAQHALTPIEDPANDDPRFERNFLTQQVVPILRERWPAWARSIARSAAHCAEADDLLSILARHDAGDLSANVLDLDPQRIATDARARNVLRAWLRERGVTPPGRARLGEFVRQVRHAGRDASPSLDLATQVLHSAARRVVLAPNADPPTSWQAPLHCDVPLTLPGDAGVLAWRAASPSPSPLAVRFRRGGERFVQPPERSLKSFLQGQHVVAWRRPWVPLVYRGEALVAIGDYWQCPSLRGALDWQHTAAYQIRPT